MSFLVKDSVALVTGANRGIGKAIVESLLNSGAAKVYAAVRTPGSVGAMVESSGGRVRALAMDLSDPASIAAAASVATDVQLVINNAGILKVFDPLSPDVFEAYLEETEINVFGLLRVAQAFAPVLANNGGGALVQLNSVASLKNFADFSSYAASKAAAYSFTQGLREKLAAQGTQVLSVHPGPISTDMANNAGLGEIAEPPNLVADGIVAALASGQFHLFPDTTAKQFEAAYRGFAQAVVEADLSGG